MTLPWLHSLLLPDLHNFAIIVLAFGRLNYQNICTQFGCTHPDIRPPEILPTTLFPAVTTATANPWIRAQNQQIMSAKNRHDPDFAYNESYTVGSIQKCCLNRTACNRNSLLSLGYSPRSILRSMKSWIPKRLCFCSLLLLFITFTFATLPNIRQ